MRPIPSVLAVAVAILSFGVFAPSVLAASTPIPLHVTKDCSAYTGITPSYCTITVSNLAAIPPGSRIRYEGPVLTNAYFLSSNVTLEAGTGNSATGYCIFQARTSKGLCTFWEGRGKLAGFTAVVDVTIDAAGLWHFDGMYYFSDEPKPPDTSTADTARVRVHRASQRPS